MSEEENLSVEDQSQGTAQPSQSDNEHDDGSNEAQAVQQSKRNDAEHNWNEVRRQMREKDQQIDDLRKQFSQIADRNPSRQEEDELAGLAEDDILTVAQAKKLAHKMAKNVAEQVLKDREASTVDERLSNKFSDYAQVVNPDTIKKLYETDPELVENLKYNPDPYKQGIAAYKLLKKMNVKEDANLTLQKKQAETNSRKPLSTQAVSKTSALADANVFAHLDAKGKKDFLNSQYEDMQRAIKGY